jgi:predicted PurR-regulated permease PerM
MISPAALGPASRALFTGACTVVVLAGIKAAAPLVNLLLLAFLITMSAEPLHAWLRRRGLTHLAATIITLTLLVLTALLVASALGVGIAGFRDRLPFYRERVEETAAALTRSLAARGLDVSTDALEMGPQQVLRLTQAVLSSLGQVLSDSVLILLVVAFIVLDRHRIDAWLDGLEKGGAMRRRWALIGVDVRKYLSLTGLFGLAAAILNYVVFLIAGVDGAVVWAILSFFLNFVPNVGFLIALLGPTLLALIVKGLLVAALVAGSMIVINFVLDSVVKPQLMSRGLELPPSLTIVSLVVWSWLLGPMGALLGIPLTVVLRRVWIEHQRVAPTDAGPQAGLPEGQTPSP